MFLVASTGYLAQKDSTNSPHNSLSSLVGGQFHSSGWSVSCGDALATPKDSAKLGCLW